MTSKSTPQACFVYVTLPGETTPITAGKFAIASDRYANPIGKFVYGKRYLAHPNAVPLDPVELKLSSTLYETTKLGGIFGILRDASPDYWGRRVIERHCGKPQLSEMDYLLFAPDDRAGALGFGLNVEPPAPKKIFNQKGDLDMLQQTADKLVNQDMESHTFDTQIDDLLLLGTSMGGARPKAVVENSDGLWIAKFNRPDDKFNQAKVEHAMLKLANLAGLSSAHSKVVDVGGRDVLLVKRFDREKVANGYMRSRMASALTVLKAEDSIRSRDRWSYIYFVEELRRISAQPQKDAEELFGRMVFNALISNTDDHPRNHAIIAKEKDWCLSPAYDLTPATPISLERRDLAMACGDEGRFASARNLLSQHARFLLEKEHATSIINSMQDFVNNRWYRVAKSVAVSEKDCEMISSAFNYPGFGQL